MLSGIVNVILICTEIFRQHSIRINVTVVKANVEKFSLSVKKKLSISTWLDCFSQALI